MRPRCDRQLHRNPIKSLECRVAFDTVWLAPLTSTIAVVVAAVTTTTTMVLLWLLHQISLLVVVVVEFGKIVVIVPFDS